MFLALCSRTCIVLLLIFGLTACIGELGFTIMLQSKITVDVTGPGHVTISQHLSECEDADQCWVTEFMRDVVLTPHAEDGSEFAGWTGDCRGLGYCKIFTNKEFHISLKDQKAFNLTAKFVPTNSLLPLTNTSTNIQEVMEFGQTNGACDRYFDNLNDVKIATEYLKLMCGKDMFFYEGFELLGIPTIIVDLLLENAPNSMGPSFSKFGLYDDPYSRYPIGLVNGKKMSGVNSKAFGCASCHFAKAGDQYSIGQANHDYDYGKHLMALSFITVQAADNSLIDQPVSDNVKAWVAPQVAEFNRNISKAKLLFKMAPMLPLLNNSSGLPLPSPAKQDMHLSWKAGTQDFVIDPVGLDDQAHTVSKMLPLWGLQELQDYQDANSNASMQLGLTGSTHNLDAFIQDFIVLSLGADKYPFERRQPLHDFIMTLQAPNNPNPAPLANIAAGKTLFDANCTACHDGPHGSSTGLYDYAALGVDDALMAWGDADVDGNPEVPELFQNGALLTHKLKAPKMNGLWAQKLFLHNGSVDSLEALFCLGSSRPTPAIDVPVFSDKGHTMTCDNSLSNTDKQLLIDYLKSL